jgi:hypothetical protein
VPPHGYAPVYFGPDERGAWTRVSADRDCRSATVFFQYSNADRRPAAPSPVFAGLPAWGSAAGAVSLLWARDGDRRTLLHASGDRVDELDGNLELRELRDQKTREWMTENLAVPRGVLREDAASVIYTDEAGRRWRLPKGSAGTSLPSRPVRVDREVTCSMPPASSTSCRRTTPAASRWCGPLRRTTSTSTTTARGAD